MMTVKAEIVPKRKCEQLASPLLQLVRAAFENPQIQEEFEQWKKEREKARRLREGEG